MPQDVWEQLAAEPVPPPPARFDRGVHERINSQLLAGQIADFMLRCLPYALWHFGRGLIGAVFFTATGKYFLETKLPKNQPPDVTGP
ncbi:MAG TPA: hypothetical protein VFE24_00140 [Pirellulales bacterium]|jgi:hypothetical protein|nr:hypothetical protein [Pirellulales bacterium]